MSILFLSDAEKDEVHRAIGIFQAADKAGTPQCKFQSDSKFPVEGKYDAVGLLVENGITSWTCCKLLSEETLTKLNDKSGWTWKMFAAGLTSALEKLST